jgi:hypothetical protein
MRMFIFILLGSQVNFALIVDFLGSVIALVLVFIFIARPLTVFLCAFPDPKAKWSLKELNLHVLDQGDLRDPRRACRHPSWYASPRREDRRLYHLPCHSCYHPSAGDHHKVAGREAGPS